MTTDFIASLTRPELHRIVAHWMGAEPWREGYCVIWPDYGRWENVGPVLDRLTSSEFAFVVGTSEGDDRTIIDRVLHETVRRAVQEMPEGVEMYHKQGGRWSWGRPGLSGAWFDSEKQARLAAWRDWLDGEMAMGVVGVCHG
ncbi:MAG: hypothetical protein ACNA8W_10465 [Bradymonadaceae bacterium]